MTKSPVLLELTCLLKWDPKTSLYIRYTCASANSVGFLEKQPYFLDLESFLENSSKYLQIDLPYI